MRTHKPTVRCLLDKTKQRKTDSLYPLFIHVNWKGTRAKETTGIYLSLTDFKKGVYLKNKTLSKRLNEIEDRIYELMIEGRKFTSNDVLSKIREKTFLQIVNECCMVKKLSYNTHYSYINTLHSLQKYFGEDFTLSDLTLHNIQGFSRSVGVQPATVWTYLKNLKSILNYAVNRGYIKENVMKGWNFKSDGYKPIDKPKSKSQEDILHYIDIYNNTKDKHIKESIGIWLSGYFFNGMALADLMLIDWNSVTEKCIEGDYYYTFNIHRKKTKEVATIMTPKTELTMSLLQLLKTEPWKKYKIRYTIVINKFLKRIDPTLTYYQCRHSFATMLVNNGVSLNTIGTLLGRKIEGLSTYVQKITEEDKLAHATRSLRIEKIEYDKKQELEIFSDLI